MTATRTGYGPITTTGHYGQTHHGHAGALAKCGLMLGSEANRMHDEPDRFYDETGVIFTTNAARVTCLDCGRAR